MKRDEVEPAYVYPLPLGAAIVMLVVMTSDLAALQICSADLDFSATKAGKKRARAMNNGRADALRAASNGRTKAPPIITQVSGAVREYTSCYLLHYLGSTRSSKLPVSPAASRSIMRLV